MPTATSAAAATRAITAVLNGNSARLRMPNAAPVLRTCVKSTSPGTIVTLSCSGSVARIAAFVSWSIATMISGSQISSRRRSARTARGWSGASGASAFSTSSIDSLGEGVLAAVADPGPGRIGGHRFDVAPAPLTFHAAGAFDRHLRQGIRARLVAVQRTELDLGHDEEHRQLARVA